MQTRETDQAKPFTEAADAAFAHGTATAKGALYTLDNHIAGLTRFLGLAMRLPLGNQDVARELRSVARGMSPEERVQMVRDAIHAGDVQTAAAMLDAPMPLRLLTDAQREDLCIERDCWLNPDALGRAKVQLEAAQAARVKLAAARTLFQREYRASLPKPNAAQDAADVALAALREGAE